VREADEHDNTDAQSNFVNHVKHKTIVRVETRYGKLLHLLLLLGGIISEEEIYLVATVTQREVFTVRGSTCRFCFRASKEVTQPWRGLAQFLGSPSAASTKKSDRYMFFPELSVINRFQTAKERQTTADSNDLITSQYYLILVLRIGHVCTYRYAYQN